MSEDEASRLVEERNSSRNWSPMTSPAGTRLQFAGTAVGGGVTTTV